MVSLTLYPQGWFQYGALVMVIPVEQSQEESGNRICHINFGKSTVCLKQELCIPNLLLLDDWYSQSLSHLDLKKQNHFQLFIVHSITQNSVIPKSELYSQRLGHDSIHINWS